MTTESARNASYRYRHSAKGKRTHRIYMGIWRKSRGKKRVKVEFSIPVEPLDVLKEERVILP